MYSEYRHSVFTGHIVLPKQREISRENYIQHCVTRHVVTVRTQFGEFIKDCPVMYSFMGFNDGFLYTFDFPQTEDELGSHVLLINVPDSNIPVVIGCMNMYGSTIQLEEEGQLKIYRTEDKGNYLIEGRALSGIINLITTGEEKTGGRINIKAVNKANIGEITLFSNIVNVTATDTINLIAYKVVEILSRDLREGDDYSSIKMELEKITLDAKEMLIGKGASEWSAKGETLLSKIETLIDYILQITVPTPTGTSGTPINAVSFQNLKTEFQEILSEKVKIE